MGIVKHSYDWSDELTLTVQPLINQIKEKYNDDIYIKFKTNSKEQEINKIASDYEISPKVIHCKDDYIIMKLYPETYSQLNEQDKIKYKSEVIRKLNQLHQLGILHGDPHMGNVMIDRNTNDVRLIDYECSNYASEFDDINEINKRYDGEFYVNCQNINDMYEFEINLMKTR